MIRVPWKFSPSTCVLKRMVRLARARTAGLSHAMAVVTRWSSTLDMAMG